MKNHRKFLRRRLFEGYFRIIIIDIFQLEGKMVESES